MPPPLLPHNSSTWLQAVLGLTSLFFLILASIMAAGGAGIQCDHSPSAYLTTFAQADLPLFPSHALTCLFFYMSHALQAALGLTGIMSCPRLTTFVLWVSGHDFQMAHVKQVILHRAEKAPAYARTGLQVLRCPFFGVVLFMCMPGFQVKTAFSSDIVLAIQLSYAQWTSSQTVGNSMAVLMQRRVNILLTQQTAHVFGLYVSSGVLIALQN